MNVTIESLNRRTVDALLNNDRRELFAIGRIMDRSVSLALNPVCGECGSAKIQDNGLSRTWADYTTLCEDCGNQDCPNMRGE